MTVVSSPGGFWTPPRKEISQFPLPATWEVPKKRKPRWDRKKDFQFCSLEKEDICIMRCGEITTQNSFSTLENLTDYGKKEDPGRGLKKEDTSHRTVNPDWPTTHAEDFFYKNIFYNNFDEFIFNINEFNTIEHRLNEYYMYMFNNKQILRAGYFPEFITPVSNNLFYNDDTHRFYIDSYNNKCVTQISNSNSRYDNTYFLKLKTAYEISKNIFNKSNDGRVNGSSSKNSKIFHTADLNPRNSAELLNRGAVGNTAATSIDPAERPLGGNTPRDSQEDAKMSSTTGHISRILTRGAVENTAATPIEEFQGGNTPRISQCRNLENFNDVDLDINKYNQYKNIRTKYYKSDNNNKRVDNHNNNNNNSYSNYNNNSIKYRNQEYPSNTHRHTYTHTQTDTHLHPLTHTQTHIHTQSLGGGLIIIIKT